MTILAIDPGDLESAYVYYDPEHPQELGSMGFLLNDQILELARTPGPKRVVVEMFSSYGMAVGQTTFDTCVWIGKITEAVEEHQAFPGELLYRKDVKHHLCGSSRARDSNVIAVLVDRYGGTQSRAKGTKKEPGPLYGIKSHIWQALALAITAAETDKAFTL